MAVTVIKQHLIDPEICIRCNTCEATCPVGAITHDSRNYVVDAASATVHGLHLALPHRQHRQLAHHAAGAAYSVEEQLTWDELPAELSPEQLAEAGCDPTPQRPAPPPAGGRARAAGQAAAFNSAQYGATLPPWSAAHAYTNLYGPKAAEKSVTATVVGNVRVTEVGRDYDTHHVVLDFGSHALPGAGRPVASASSRRAPDANGRPHHARQYDRQPAQRRAAPATTTCR
jgi:benzoyl-CoA 2,3-dioxygenase component A